MKKRRIILLVSLLLCLALTNGVTARKAKVLDVSVGQSKLLKIPGLKRVAVANPKVADVITISEEELLINGKSTGKTTLHLWTKAGNRLYKVQVDQDEEPIINQVEELINIETVEVAKIDETIILTGTVKDQNDLRKAKKIADVFGKKVIDQLKVKRTLQVLIEAHIFEIDKTNSEELGFDWYSVNSAGVDLGSGTALFGEDLYDDSADPVKRDPSPRFGLGDSARLSELRARLEALIQEGKATLLAKPKLVTKSGKEANFAVGGEVPIVTSNDSGEQTVIWKEYGVQFKIKPTVTKSGKLNTYLNPKVSRLDWANAVEGLPAIKSSEVATEVVIPDGSTLAIGGLIQHSRSKDIKKLPLLGDLPILGRLFRSEAFREGESELIILVTPKIINSAAASQEEMNENNILKEKKKIEQRLKSKKNDDNQAVKEDKVKEDRDEKDKAEGE
ncbi:type II and III secretion system protein family protein [Selenihalanaerobacter shriftii]|uniref:Pilus assembly protein CpaC n=1 Tax=Selenihalanaerobacter shriftii TaxID=142842 RepID=A0A1T4KQ73_9FIRM|nr:pilus assembly protein N-terminal domain-containing protein [Selenihalanaerobacter shriftii]SJZ44550.1 pilus assembly protein CpaC [Selenihalanaerobacter shriftii]